jgi:hypothetical protein
MSDSSTYITSFGYKYWTSVNGLHRTDGPAMIGPDGISGWFLHGNWMPFDDWLDKHPDMTDEEKVMFKLEHG